MTKYQHAEAFCLMQYETKDKLLREVVWNSRDGVTPFGFDSDKGLGTLYHVDFKLDRCLPNYTPVKGQLVFVNATPELVMPKVHERVEQSWAVAKERFNSKREMIQYLVRDWVGDGDRPFVIRWEQ